MSRAAATLVTLLLAVTVPFGCRTTRKLELTQAGAPAFDRLDAEYSFSAASFHLERTFAASADQPETAANASAVQRVKAERTTPAGDTDSAPDLDSLRPAQLKIECPASPDTPDEARLTLQIPTATPGTSNDSGQEVRQLIIPRQQIELLLLDLARTGFFDDTDPPGARSPLTVTIDGARVSRNWRADDRLLDFAHRVFHLGRVAQD